MSEKLKPSRYNHFIEQEDGSLLAFNAISCGLGEMSREKFEIYEEMASSGNGSPVIDEKFLEDLKKGGFLIPEDLDELDALRAGHYQARFGNNGFGLTIIPTLNCNFACDYCYEDKRIHSLPAKEGGMMSDEVCDNIIKLCENRIMENSAFTVTWYGGEPLLAKMTIENLSKQLIEICKKKNSKYRAGIITNGYLLRNENIKFLIDNNVTFVQITLDGPKSVHDKRRPLNSGAPTFEKILRNI